jgi:hypothetical protein
VQLVILRGPDYGVTTPGTQDADSGYVCNYPEKERIMHKSQLTG